MSECLNLLYSKRNLALGGGSFLIAIMLAVSAVPSVAQGLDPQTHIPQLQTTTTGLPDLPQPALKLPTLNNYASPSSPENNPLVQTRELDLKARLSEGGGDIPAGLVWRVFSPDVGPDGQLPLIASAQGGGAVFNLPEGSYLVHVAYGRAGATKRITVGNATRHEVMMLDAGGMKLSAILPDGGKINNDLLRFSIYADEDNSDRSLIVPDVKPNTIIRLNSGTYHVVSNYGSANAIIRADIRVEAGKLTEATVQHRAAEVTLKLVRERGGEALADTSWSVLNASGDVVRESAGAYSSMVLIEGDYVAVAKNKDRIYQRDFKVSSGKNEEVEVVANGESESVSDSVD
ncbi:MULTISPECIES: hypothetical protein [Brucella/Ochrobactrum group]|jgi:hypothetical protein|uniref:Uncharacterized protein n=2 Tax=Brucella pseudintermedia TaxID=370111 RepID=A0ABY5UDE4_9HYPH|nr:MULTISPECIES: hypothetical protein [Brucella/Ochrobactrum group]KAB2684160.1 hypothetical protein F9K78_05665 [Brucella pseudintermedia]NKE77236.1 hypothetical protein [Ochrobactrum sp. MC-1LL]UWL60727.1 hypothetical protein NIK97_02920 [Brucella pseudintermedia]WPM81332.1 hypothetical protein R5W60_06555 [Brucella pseudintermedia]